VCVCACVSVYKITAKPALCTPSLCLMSTVCCWKLISPEGGLEMSLRLIKPTCETRTFSNDTGSKNRHAEKLLGISTEVLRKLRNI